MTGAGALVGTPSYMAPEQLLDARQADAKSDLWALAVVAYQAITGRLPFQGKTVASLGHRIAQGQFDPPSRVREGLPPPLDAWFARALASDPQARWAGAVELAASFAELVDGLHSTPKRREAAPRAAPPESVGAETFDGAARSTARGPTAWRRGVLIAAAIVAAGVIGWTATADRGGPTPASAPSGGSVLDRAAKRTS